MKALVCIRGAAISFGALLVFACSDSGPDNNRGGGGAGSGGTFSSPGGNAGTSGSAVAVAGTNSGGTNSGGASGADNASGMGGTAVAGSSNAGTSFGGNASGTGGGGTSGGSSPGGSSSGGSSGLGSSGAGSGGAASNYPCDGKTTGYNAVMTKNGSTWTVVNGTRQVYSGASMEAGLRAAYGSLTPGRTTKESILVQGSGDIPASSQVGIPSYTILNVCGTINVAAPFSGNDRSPLYARNQRDIEIPNVKMTGIPQYGIFLRQTNNVHLGNVDMRLSPGAGIGIRADNAASQTVYYQNLRIDYVYGSGMDSHIVETVGIDNIQIGTVEGNDVGESGVLLNRSTNATIDLVRCTNCASGVGYAAFRMANRNGAISGNWDQTNIRVRSVVARGGGRGVFCVSESGAAHIEHVDIENTGGNSILLENCYNVTVGNATRQSRVASSGELRIAARTEFANSRDITFQNIAVSGTPVRENPCAPNSTWTNVTSAPTNCN